MGIISWIIFGLLAGILAKIAMPGIGIAEGSFSRSCWASSGQRWAAGLARNWGGEQ